MEFLAFAGCLVLGAVIFAVGVIIGYGLSRSTPPSEKPETKIL